MKIKQDIKDAAAVLCGGVLEQHIKQLCDKYDVPKTRPNGNPENVGRLNEELVKAGTYGKLDQSKVTTWYHIRTAAAHARYDEYDKSEVNTFLMGLQGFIEKYPA